MLVLCAFPIGATHVYHQHGAPLAVFTSMRLLRHNCGWRGTRLAHKLCLFLLHESCPFLGVRRIRNAVVRCPCMCICGRLLA